ncbi:hypothetical protein GX51_06390 [Blastomyces parvus]|uniref:RSE1/DDB1/CPSF1 first beta-propeller domain-containing protein n=1 Tax=Blastomyces parvus TaxID=2060905 RepID=A0A2B7WRI1_9EURO|nr:hypothetical protein GX51_06390 [Blastomyces parvus]
MSLQTTYLTDGNWTTRQVNIRDIMSSKQGTSDADPASKPARRRVPPTGLLSRTVMPGPLIQLVLPARLRHRDKHDIVFVGDDFIQIKELVPNGHLEDIATKADFDTKILDAKVIGNPGNAITGTPFREGDELGALSSTLPDDSWHRQILVLVLASRELLFLYGAENPSGRPEFIHVRRPLPSDVSSLEQYGRYIAIDHGSRAMAVSAAHKFFGIFSLKSPSAIRAAMEGGPVNPIQEERFFRADGDIIAMDFLHPAAGDEDRIVLMLLVNNLTKTHIACYTWKAGDGLANVEAKRIKPRILPEFRLPSLFIPLKFATSCLLVSQAGYCVYEINLADSTVSMRDKCSDDQGGQPCTAWVRPRRNISHHQIEDDLYLCRQDGELSYLEIKKMTGESWWLLKDIRIKSIGCNVDRGFAILDSGFKAGGDILVAAGSMGDGGLFLLGARKNSRCLQKIPNWAPVLDSVVIKAPDSQGAENHQNGRKAVEFAFDRIFTCSWDGLYRGSITELRHGIEARAGLVIDQEDSSSVLDMWTIPNRQTGGTYFLFSKPLSSSVLSVPVEDDLYEMNEEDTGLELETQTIAAGSSPEGVVVQVTDMSIHLSVLENTALRYSTRCQNPAERIVAAAVSGALSLFAAAVRTTSGILVHLQKVEINDGNLQCPTVGQPLPLACEPVNLTIEVILSQPVLFIGTTEGKLLAARIDPTLGLVPLLEQSILLPPGNDESTVCESFVVITVPRRRRTKTTLFSGLRSGNLVSFDVRLDRDSGNIALVQTDVRKLGNTSVRIRRYESDTTFAIVTCGRGLWRLSDVEDEESDEFVLHKIWVTDQNNPARVQSTIDVFTCVDFRPDFNSGGLGGSLACITRNQILCCILEKTPKTVPRHIALPGSPKRIIYSEYLKRLVVAYNAVEFKETPECVKRWRRPRIDFIDPDDEKGVSSSISLMGEPEGAPEAKPGPWRPTGGSGEEVTALLDWSVSSGDNVHHMVVAATAQPHSAHRGRVIYIIARPCVRTPGQIDSIVKYVLDYEDPVRAIAPFKPSSLVLAVGARVIFQTLDPVAKKWRKRPAYRLESDAVAITVREPYIYVLTLKNSLCILRVTDTDTGLTLHGQDGSDRESLDLVNLQDDSRITMTSTLGGAIVGLTEVGLTPEDKLIHKAFTAHMPLSVIRLSRSSRPAATTPGLGSEVTYGTTIDGTVYRFTTLSEPQWRLLRFIQNVCMKEPSICPLARRKRRNSIDTWEVTVSKPESLHVNGDILSRLVEGGIGQLRRVMGAEEAEDRMSESSEGAGSGGGEKVSRFLEFAAAVVPGAEDPFVAVMAWMGSMVQISL